MVAAATGMAIHEPDRVAHETSKPLSWATPIRSVLGEDFALDDLYASENTTIEDVLSHRSGLSGHDSILGPWLGQSPQGITKRIRFLGPLTKLFRTAMQYNNVMYAVAGDVLETITGMRCGEVLRDWLWTPLKMHRTYWHLQEALDDSDADITKQMSRGYFWVGKAGHDAKASNSAEGYYIPELFIDFAGDAPAGAVLSNVLDYARWVEALLASASPSDPDRFPGDAANEERPEPTTIPAALFKDLSTPRITVPTSNLENAQMIPSLYSLGWAIPLSSLGPLHPLLGHGGGLSGYGTIVFLLPNDSFGVVAMANTVGSGNIVGALLCQDIIARRMGLKEKNKELELKIFQEVVSLDYNWDPEDTPDRELKDAKQQKNPDAAAAAKHSLERDDFIRKAEQELETMTRYDGIYRNPAYGDFKVTLASATSKNKAGGEEMETGNITYRHTADKALNVVKDEIRASTHSYRVEAVGKRTLKFAYLLHPRQNLDHDQSSACHTSQDFDQETLVGHGYTEDDVAPGVPTGAEDDEKDARCRKENSWESVFWTKLGAAFVPIREGRGFASLTNPKLVATGSKRFRLGLTLANELVNQHGSREEGWGKKMMWFEPVCTQNNIANPN